MASLRRHEGYLLIDNSLAARNLPDPWASPADRARAAAVGFIGLTTPVLEVPIATCSHCNRGVVLNPGRTRERAYCLGCDRYLCDPCALLKKLGAVCVPMLQIVEETQERAAQALAIGEV